MNLTENNNEELNQLWCVAANVKKEHPFGEWGSESKSGTKQFRGGTKVYIIERFCGACTSVEVIGLQRHTRKFITCIVHVQHLENFRAKLIYNPAVLEKCQDDTLCWIKDREEAECSAKMFARWENNTKR